METIEVIQGILGLWKYPVNRKLHMRISWMTHVHHVFIDNEGRTLSFGVVAYPDLPDATIASKEVVQVLSCN